ncbi:J517_1871 family lipoprotein [Alloalcanivorax gelatiniphagus]|uniref:Lipoprotein n=1 Tax=Alloalcanivorax gelatiniphagus TaxID=1194167 RepID=A0ABY2XR73_9GAMM|nr:J517_1871 family lipoprotein [Alloalcanivorax gelatiniphagus]TMW14261.1 hypothetical protein FGS76_03770 [Alloalcanivorax gelatiniphagus]
MRFALGILLAAALLSGCATPLDDLLEGGYSEAKVQPAPASLVGTWTGSMGSYLVTLVVEPDGTGRYCHSWNEKNAVSLLKYDGERLVFQDGARAELISASSDKLILKPSYKHAKESVLRADRSLRAASLYCRSALR